MALSTIQGLLVVFALSSIGCDMARAQDKNNQLPSLVETSARRLMISEQVALSKWDSGTPVQDAPREAKVMATAIAAGESKGLDRTWVANFFSAQVEASKTVQYSLLADWERKGVAPAHPPIDLVRTIRPQLDQLHRELIEELVDIAPVRFSRTCHGDVARATGKYVSAHKEDFGPRYAIALDRALATVCSR